ncbi:MAG: hypothetical protein R3B13_02095 [Polyangiaceae bacterium]
MRYEWLLVLGMVSCGGAKAGQAPEAQAPEAREASASPVAPEEAASAESPAESSGSLPTECTKTKSDLCVPANAFVQKLCEGNYPAVALAMFQKATPWTRGYLTRKTKAWNASGGASDSDELAFDEEVLVLRHRSSDMGGMQVSGAGGGYDALRWNGSCVTLAAEELTLKLPPAAKSSKVEWRYLDDGQQTALRNDEKIDSAYKERRNECKGATMGSVTLKCEKADKRLSEVIIAYVRGGGSVPTPEKLP